MRTLLLAFVVVALAVAPAGASTGQISLSKAKSVAVVKMKKIERKLRSEGANKSGVRGCWREKDAVGCLGIVSGKDSFLRWRCAVPMTIRKRPGASASRRVAVKYTDAMCSF